MLTLNNHGVRVWKGLEKYEIDDHQVRLFNVQPQSTYIWSRGTWAHRTQIFVRHHIRLLGYSHPCTDDIDTVLRKGQRYAICYHNSANLPRMKCGRVCTQSLNRGFEPFVRLVRRFLARINSEAQYIVTGPQNP
jgi:hypothetical protein